MGGAREDAILQCREYPTVVSWSPSQVTLTGVVEQSRYTHPSFLRHLSRQSNKKIPGIIGYLQFTLMESPLNNFRFKLHSFVDYIIVFAYFLNFPYILKIGLNFCFTSIKTKIIWADFIRVKNHLKCFPNLNKLLTSTVWEIKSNVLVCVSIAVDWLYSSENPSGES